MDELRPQREEALRGTMGGDEYLIEAVLGSERINEWIEMHNAHYRKKGLI